MIYNRKLWEWLKMHQIELEESFPDALCRLAEKYRSSMGMKRLEDVYKLVGISKQNISYWEKNIGGTQTKKFSI